GNHHFDQYWHLSDKSMNKVQISEDAQSVLAPHLKLISALEDLKAKLETGYISYNYRQKNEAPVIRYSLQGKPPVVWPTVLYPFKSKEPDLRFERLMLKMNNENKDSSGTVALQLSSAKSTDFFFEQEKEKHPYKDEKFETDAKMVFIRFDPQKRIIGYQMVGGSFLNYHGKKVAQIFGTLTDVSVQSDRVEIEGDDILSFQLRVPNTPEVFLNEQKIAVTRKDYMISFSRVE
ncbi:MAG: hypothetical protein ACE5NG_16255, partial [bacterium]